MMMLILLRYICNISKQVHLHEHRLLLSSYGHGWVGEVQIPKTNNIGIEEKLWFKVTVEVYRNKVKADRES